ncbi:hypothetical protein BRAS3843_1260023 [Bradyrhizobium sp. STM 3843]|nr:hypothetical protein BRAS3843_1260023 [Bradyrhizobium sp. STM 3843]
MSGRPTLASARSRDTDSTFAGEKWGDNGAAVKNAADTINPRSLAFLVMLFSPCRATIQT